MLPDGKGEIPPVALYLVGCCCPYRGVEGNVACAIVGRACLDVAPALEIGGRLAAPTALPPREPVEFGIQLSCDFELFAGLNFLPAFPPVRVLGLEDYLLAGGLGGGRLRRLVNGGALV